MVRVADATFQALKAQALSIIREQGTASSFTLKKIPAFKEANATPSIIRRVFTELMEDGLILPEGEKRSRRYKLAPIEDWP